MSILPDHYDFDMHAPWNADSLSGAWNETKRDVYTMVGASFNWLVTHPVAQNLGGTGYTIHFTGTIPVPKDLPQ